MKINISHALNNKTKLLLLVPYFGVLLPTLTFAASNFAIMWVRLLISVFTIISFRVFELVFSVKCSRWLCELSLSTWNFITILGSTWSESQNLEAICCWENQFICFLHSMFFFQICQLTFVSTLHSKSRKNCSLDSTKSCSNFSDVL